MKIRIAGSKRGCVFIFKVDFDFLFPYTFFELYYSNWRSGFMKAKKIIVLARPKTLKEVANSMACCRAGAPAPFGPEEE